MKLEYEYKVMNYVAVKGEKMGLRFNLVRFCNFLPLNTYQNALSSRKHFHANMPYTLTLCRRVVKGVGRDARTPHKFGTRFSIDVLDGVL